MRHVIISLLLTLSTVAAGAQGVVTWLETEHDFGTFLESDGKVTCHMRMVNTGTADLIITRVKPSCGCTASEFTRSPIAPGDTGIVTLTYNPYRRPGEFDKDAFVYTNGEPARSLIKIKGNVVPSVETLEDQFPVTVGSIRYDGATFPLGTIIKGRGQIAVMSGINTSTTPMVITAHDAPKHIVVKALPDTVPAGASSTVTVFFDSKYAPLWGLNADEFTLMAQPANTGTSAASGFTKVEVMAVVQEDFSRMTERERDKAPHATISCGDRLNFDTATKGNIVQQSFQITNSGHDRLLLRRLWSGSNGITAVADREEIKRNKSATITVTVDTSKYDEPILNALLNIMTNDPDVPSRTIRLVGEIK